MLNIILSYYTIRFLFFQVKSGIFISFFIFSLPTAAVSDVSVKNIENKLGKTSLLPLIHFTV